MEERQTKDELLYTGVNIAIKSTLQLFVFPQYMCERRCVCMSGSYLGGASVLLV